MSDDNVGAKIKERLENAERAAEKPEDELEQAAEQKIEPHPHEARARWRRSAAAHRRRPVVGILE
jgi:hypothetical protein